MKKILYLITLIIVFITDVFGIDVGMLNKHNDKTTINIDGHNVGVVYKTQDRVINIYNNYIKDYSNGTIKGFNGYFTHDGNMDIFSYGKPIILLGNGYKYIPASYYLFVNKNNGKIKIKSYIIEEENIEEVIGDRYDDKQPNYLGYIVLSNKYKNTLDLNIKFRSYINNLSENARKNLLNRIDSEVCVDKIIYGKKITICGIQKNPKKISTYQTKEGYIITDGYENDIPFWNNEINIKPGINTMFVGFIGDLLYGFEDKENSYIDKPKLSFVYGINIEGGAILPSFIGKFKDIFINIFDDSLKEIANQNYDYNVFKLIDNITETLQSYNNGINDIVYKINTIKDYHLYRHGIGYLYLNNELTDTNNNNNYTFEAISYLFGNKIVIVDNFKNNTKAGLVISNLDDTCYQAWIKEKDTDYTHNFKIPGEKLYNSNIKVKGLCENLNKKGRKDYVFGNLKMKVFNINGENNYKIFFHTKRDSRDYYVIFSSNTPLIFRNKKQPEGIHGVVYIPDKKFTLENKTVNIELITDIWKNIEDDNVYIIANKNNKTLVSDEDGKIKEANIKPYNVNTNLLKTLMLFIHTNIVKITSNSKDYVIGYKLIEDLKLYTKELGNNIFGILTYNDKNDNKKKKMYFKIEKNNSKIYFFNTIGEENIACDYEKSFNYLMNSILYRTKIYKGCNINTNFIDTLNNQVSIDFVYIKSKLFSTEEDKFIFNGSYNNKDLTKFKDKAYDDLIEDGMLITDNNYNRNINKSIIVLYNIKDDKKVLDKIIFARTEKKQKGYVLIPYNKDTDNFVYNSVNDFNIISSDYIPVNVNNINFVNGILKYKDYDKNKFWFVMDTNGKKEIEIGKEYNITTYFLSNFNFLKNLVVNIQGGDYIKQTRIECGNRTYETQDYNFIFNYNNNLVGECKIIVKIKIDNNEQLRQLIENGIIINTQAESDGEIKQKEAIIKYTFNKEMEAHVENGILLGIKSDESDQLVKNLITKYNGFTAQVMYNILTNKIIKYTKISLQLTNEDFEFIPNPLIDRKYNLQLGKMFNDKIIRNKTRYDIIIPFSNIGNSYIYDGTLSMPIQLQKNLKEVEDRETEIKLEVKYVYIDGSEQILYDNAKVKVKGVLNKSKDYVTAYVYNLKNKDETIYSSSFEKNGEKIDRYAVLEINYFHVGNEIERMLNQTRIPGNYQGDEDGIGPGVGRGSTNGIIRLDTHGNFYNIDYIPPYNGSKENGHSIEDKYTRASDYRDGNFINNTRVRVIGVCSTYKTPISNVPLDYDEGRGYGGYKKLVLYGEFYIHSNIYEKNNQFGQFMQPVILQKVVDGTYNITWKPGIVGDYEVLFSDENVFYQKKSGLKNKMNEDIEKLKPRIILSKEFEGMIEKIDWDRSDPQEVSLSKIYGNIDHFFTKYPFVIHIYLKDTKDLGINEHINFVKNNELYKLLDKGENKKLLTIQLPSVVNGVYEGGDLDIANVFKTNNIEQKNDFIIEFTQQSQRNILIKMQLEFNKYIVSKYRKGYVFAYNYDQLICNDGGCYCRRSPRGAKWIDLGIYEYLYGYSSFKKLKEVYNNYVVSAYRPIEKIKILGLGFVKGENEKIDYKGEEIDAIPTEYTFKEKKRLDENKKIGIVEYLLKNKDFKKEEYNNIRNYNLHDKLIEETEDEWMIFYYKNSFNLKIEKQGNVEEASFEDDITVKYKGKKIFIIDGDLYLNTNLIPNDYKKDFVVFVVLGNVYVNAQAQYANRALFVKGDYIILDGEKTFINHGPLVVNGYVLSYRTANHILPFILNYLNEISNVDEELILRSSLKRSVVLMNDGRWIGIKIFIKKIFTDKKFTK